MQQRKIGPALTAALLMITLLAGCGSNRPNGRPGDAGQQTRAPSTQQPGDQGNPGQQAPGESAAGEGKQTVYPITLIDGDGREITIEAEPQRILSLGPSATEVLFALGRGDRLVGRTDWCNFPEAALEVPSVGSLFPPDYERILSTEPDLVVMIEGSVDVRERLEQEYGLTVFVYAPATFEQLYTQMVALGQAVNAREAAEAIVAEIQGEVDAIYTKILPISYSPSVFYQVWPDPLSTAGPGSFIDDMIRIAGGINVAGDADSAWPAYSLEQLLAADPAVIVAGSEAMAQDILTRPGWESLRAVREGRVYGVPNEDIVVRPGPRLAEGLRWFAETLHPGLFGR
ncbi:iron complex transport system substrate-binding protein [Symbiobacterium terraclitae]|uniref:Iron complex transport system substrate-binding protein n=1 Tax=Symbiobacterium terraclitae TaxID=557451 RepID=A0ABS4JVI5_9FIRM|nr:cobalamin-binding protein [Symbiobacterium terraclitae]MBP2018439.1 iron complex transport system substrate-binding protein [Symbiobacterium terraclitae]